MAVRVVVSGAHLYFVQCFRKMIKNLKHYGGQFMMGITAKFKNGAGDRGRGCLGALL